VKSKIQGEGDYEAARRFNEKQRKFVQRGGAVKKTDGTVTSDMAAAEKAAKARAKLGDQDGRDAVLTTQLVRAKLEQKKDKGTSRR
jgi:hypothetical protein